MDERRVALIVATDRYDDPGLSDLAASPSADAEVLATTLSDPQLGNFDVDILLNPTSWQADQHVHKFLTSRRPSDLVLLHFSCHGLKDDAGELYLAATNTLHDQLAPTAVEAARVTKWMTRSRANRVVLLLDCCYGGAFERGVVARAGDGVHVGEHFSPGSLGGGRGRVVITASDAMQYAFQGTEIAAGGRPSPSYFTHALVNGIRTGAADLDRDGRVSLDELYDHVYDIVTTRSPDQTPSRWSFGVQGDLYIAANPHRLSPAQLPAELLARLGSDAVEERLAALEQAATFAGADDLPVAAAAAEAIRKLTDDDSRRVSGAAEHALQLIAPRPSRSIVDLGTLHLGSTARTDVLIEGSTLALASTVQAAEDAGVRARIDHKLLVVEATPQHLGPWQSTVTLAGPAGAAGVEFRADVVPQDENDHDVDDVSGPNLAVVVPLALLGAVAMAAARWLPVRVDGFAAHASLRDSEDLLLLPAVAVLVASAFVGRRSMLPLAVGIWAGAGAWSGIFFLKRTVSSLFALGFSGTVQGTFLTGHWGRLVAAVLLGLAVVTTVVAVPDLRARVTRQRGPWTMMAAAFVVAGAVTPIVEIMVRSPRGSVQVITEWLLAGAACVAVTVLRLNSAQRRAAVVAVLALCVFTVVRDVWLILVAERPDPHPTVVLTAGALIAAGTLIGQSRPASLAVRAA